MIATLGWWFVQQPGGNALIAAEYAALLARPLAKILRGAQRANVFLVLRFVDAPASHGNNRFICRPGAGRPCRFKYPDTVPLHDVLCCRLIGARSILQVHRKRRYPAKMPCPHSQLEVAFRHWPATWTQSSLQARV
jgi:hypothetical protein